MALCPSCGNEVADFASFCTSCGHRLGADARPDFAARSTEKACSSCGAMVDAASAFCTECGQRMSSVQTAAAPVETPASAEAGPIPAAPAEPARVSTAVVASVNEPAPSAAAAVTLCSCGARLEPESKFCTVCGQPASPRPAACRVRWAFLSRHARSTRHRSGWRRRWSSRRRSH